jgi:hypothetical protein
MGRATAATQVVAVYPDGGAFQLADFVEAMERNTPQNLQPIVCYAAPVQLAVALGQYDPKSGLEWSGTRGDTRIHLVVLMTTRVGSECTVMGWLETATSGRPDVTISFLEGDDEGQMSVLKPDDEHD